MLALYLPSDELSLSVSLPLAGSPDFCECEIGCVSDPSSRPAGCEFRKFENAFLRLNEILEIFSSSEIISEGPDSVWKFKSSLQTANAAAGLFRQPEEEETDRCAKVGEILRLAYKRKFIVDLAFSYHLLGWALILSRCGYRYTVDTMNKATGKITSHVSNLTLPGLPSTLAIRDDGNFWALGYRHLEKIEGQEGGLLCCLRGCPVSILKVYPFQVKEVCFNKYDMIVVAPFGAPGIVNYKDFEVKSN